MIGSGESAAVGVSETVEKEPQWARLKKYQFKKGQSGNPLGMPKRSYTKEDIESLTRRKGRLIINRVFWIAFHSSPLVSLRACEVLLERGWGKPVETVNLGGEGVQRIILISPEGESIEDLIRERRTLSLPAPEAPAITESEIVNPAIVNDGKEGLPDGA